MPRAVKDNSHLPASRSKGASAWLGHDVRFDPGAPDIVSH
jgi:hypothetical protein